MQGIREKFEVPIIKMSFMTLGISQLAFRCSTECFCLPRTGNYNNDNNEWHSRCLYIYIYIYMHACMHAYIHTYIHFYSGICTGTGNIFIGDFRMSMLRWFWESTPKWLSFKMRLSFWLQLTYWYDQMRNKDWHFRVAWPGIELSTCRVTGRCLIHFTTSESVIYDGFTRTVSSVNTKSTNFEEKVIPGI